MYHCYQVLYTIHNLYFIFLETYYFLKHIIFIYLINLFHLFYTPTTLSLPPLLFPLPNSHLPLVHYSVSVQKGAGLPCA